MASLTCIVKIFCTTITTLTAKRIVNMKNKGSNFYEQANRNRNYEH
jgi:hypothetical protein